MNTLKSLIFATGIIGSIAATAQLDNYHEDLRKQLVKVDSAWLSKDTALYYSEDSYLFKTLGEEYVGKVELSVASGSTQLRIRGYSVKDSTATVSFSYGTSEKLASGFGKRLKRMGYDRRKELTKDMNKVAKEIWTPLFKDFRAYLKEKYD